MENQETTSSTYVGEAIEFTINGNPARCIYTHANGRGIITTFVYRNQGNISSRSFCLSDFKTVEEFLIHEYPKVKIS
jgi:hypothetical protein